ncbi:17572_t:CDS:2, partial [Gigaspora rosea]
ALSELVWFYGTLELSPSSLVLLILLKLVRLFWGLESDVKETLSESCSPESPLKLGSLTLVLGWNKRNRIDGGNGFV